MKGRGVAVWVRVRVPLQVVAKKWCGMRRSRHVLWYYGTRILTAGAGRQKSNRGVGGGRGHHCSQDALNSRYLRMNKAPATGT